MTTTTTIRKPLLRGWSHLAMFPMAIVAAGWLVVDAPTNRRWGAVIFGLAVASMFGASALNHRVDWSARGAERALQLDHTAIFLCIAGSWTPVGILALHGRLADLSVAGVWMVAITGIVFEWLPVRAPKGWITTVTIVTGWLAVITVPKLWSELGAVPTTLTVLGGLVYTAGALGLGARWPDPRPETFGYHEIWHVMVIIAVSLHYTVMAGWVV
ncbi:MAG: hemolysin III family protein [Actinomycetia bacterium]|nr:hemolysin III family protein [Actinomycetes bacterium]MCP3911207.1 hemolysin III family protein [Actinomycetes bacterium]MCP4083457.1 hemolysin III family protein [Actinomycetes bacterium]